MWVLLCGYCLLKSVFTLQSESVRTAGSQRTFFWSRKPFGSRPGTYDSSHSWSHVRENNASFFRHSSSSTVGWDVIPLLALENPSWCFSTALLSSRVSACHNPVLWDLWDVWRSRNISSFFLLKKITRVNFLGPGRVWRFHLSFLKFRRNILDVS